MSKTARRAVLGVAALASTILLAPPALASHNLVVTDAAAPAAVHGQSLNVTVAVASSCRDGFLNTCGGIGVTLQYTAPGVGTRAVSRSVPNAPAQTLTLTIPASDVQGPTLTYSVTASQQTCAGLFTVTCHTTTARSPAAGDHIVVVA